MTYVFAFDHPHDGDLASRKALLGGKGANLAVMTTELGLPVPPGFTVSTEACREYFEGGWPDGLDDEIRRGITRLEAQVGRRFGDAEDPLLISVRSGAPISMPGMMDTILNLGINDATAEGLRRVTGDEAFVAACRDRFSSMYREIVKADDVPNDPWTQLRNAVEAVFRSWHSERARAYRAHEGIPEDLGTAVNVQAMVFGNRDGQSATGVLFTRNPATGEAAPYGDVMFNAQGEDVVAGTHETLPIAELDGILAGPAAELRRYADILERHYADVCDIEFTIEQGRLWLLQTRIGKRTPQAALRIAVEMADASDFPLSRAEAIGRVADHLIDPPRVAALPPEDLPVVAAGLAASPGIASGAIVLSPDDAVEVAATGTPVILVRRATSPDDVHGMAAARGILTSTGGIASHAAVVARGWGIPAVVGASAVQISETGLTIGDDELAAGDMITINGGTGEIMIGAAGTETLPVPEATILLTWARKLGIDIAPTREGTSAVSDEEAMPAEAEAQIDRNTLIRTLAIKGFVTADALAEIFGVSEDTIGAALDGLVADGVALLAGPMFQLTDDGKSVAGQLSTADQEAWGLDRATAALDSFLAIDVRMKEIVTAWQMKQIDGEIVLNDHTDADYDATVLSDFASLAADADDWLAPLTEELRRLDLYRTRLTRAARLVADGDHQYIASPRLDSYHNIWFELHEDLILLAGRTREDEVAEGRA
jgi:pyruvate,orthophosphate dikinase